MNPEDLPLHDSQLKDAHRVAYLIAGYIRKTLTPAEHKELDDWVAADERNVELFEQLTDEENIQKALAWYERINTEKALRRVKRRLHINGARSPLPFWSWGAAIAIVVLILIGVTIIVEKKDHATAAPIAKAHEPANDRAPGGNKAILTLSDGRVLALDGAPNGNIAVQGNTEVVKKDSALSYNTSPQLGIKQESVYNTLSTPRGGLYSLTLGDGTKVWLNTASSLRFPTAFTGKERNVELTGEAYFEVAKDPSRPFHVQVGATKVEVLGTHFNINAYADDGFVRTTLLEGSVQVSEGRAPPLRISPGSDAVSGADGVRAVKSDAEKVMGWRNGNFVFHATPLKEVLHEIERWYNVDIINESGNQSHLNATFPRTVALSKLLAYLEGTGTVQFKWEKGELIVEK